MPGYPSLESRKRRNEYALDTFRSLHLAADWITNLPRWNRLFSLCTELDVRFQTELQLSFQGPADFRINW